MNENVSEVAKALAKLVPAYPERAAVDLHEMMSFRLSSRTPAQQQEIELGLLVEMIETEKRLPNREEYREEVAIRAAEGQDHWWTDAQLYDVFGKWEYVLSAAIYVIEDRWDRRVRRKGDGRVAPNRKRKYTRDECKDAVIQFREDVGDWPRQASEYQFWQKLKRRHAVLIDAASAEWLPTSRIIAEKFGDWERALELSKKKYDARF